MLDKDLISQSVYGHEVLLLRITLRYYRFEYLGSEIRQHRSQLLDHFAGPADRAYDGGEFCFRPKGVDQECRICCTRMRADQHRGRTDYYCCGIYHGYGEFANINRFLDDLHNLTHPIPLKPIPLNIHKTIDEVIEAFRPEVERKGIRVFQQFQGDNSRISADRFAIERVLKNLILNAIEAMPQGGDLVLKTRADGQWMEITIQDTGCGIPRERLGMIFEDYVTTKRKGLGLGLAISKKIVQDLNGTIEVESEPGKGTTFTLKFPLQ